MPAYYEFQNKVKICSGDNALENIPHELKTLGAARPLLLSDEGLLKIGAVETVKKAISPVEVGGVFTAVPPEGCVEAVNDAARFYTQNGCDSIIAVGGGSVIDTAKGARLVVGSGETSIKSLMGVECIPKIANIPFIAVPTTSGTGSEATPVAVISDTENRVKMEYISPHLVPDTAILDVRMTKTLPPRITASTGIDAFCHAVEAFSCLQKNPISDAFAVSAIKLISENLKTAVTKPGDKSARIAMANAAALSGVSFGNSMVGLVHAIGHSLGAVCHIPHGDAMAILLPHVMEYNLDKCGNEYGELLLFLSPEDYVSAPREKRAEMTLAQIRQLLDFCRREASLPLTLSETGKVGEDDFAAIARGAVNDGAIIVNMAYASERDIVNILKKAW